MAHRTNVPTFGNWESQDNVAYTVFFEKARKNRGTKMINPNNPQENPGMFPGTDSPSSVAPRPSAKPRPNPNEPIGREAVRPTGDLKPIREQDIHVRQFSSSTARNENAAQRILGNKSNRGSRVQRPVNAVRSTAAFGQNLEHFPNPQLPAKFPGKASVPDDNSHGGGVGKSRQRPPREDDSADIGAAIPKFGEWNESDPQAAAKFTDMFNRVREEKNNEAKNNVAGNAAKRSPYIATTARPPTKSTKICCFPW